MSDLVEPATDLSRPDIRHGRTRPTRTLTRTSAFLFAGALGALAFAVWYSSGPITASATIETTPLPGNAGDALSHPKGGIVTQILVREGQKVKAGDTLLVLQGGRITAPTDGAIVGVGTLAPGDLVRPGAKVLGIVPMPVLALHT